jgi:hypothetical protein
MDATRAIGRLIGLAGALLLLSTPQSHAQEGNASFTTIPVMFTHSIDASKAKAGDVVTAKTMQVVKLADGTEVPKGSTITGHVTVARPFAFDPADYAVQQPSILAVRFDKLAVKGGPSSEINLSVRAMANRLASEGAETPQHFDETDVVGRMVLIGGDDSYSPLAKPVVSPDGDVVGYNRRQGVYARLFGAGSACDANQTEQAVWIYSPSACGLYGFADVSMSQDGRGGDQGTFQLESRHHTVKLYGQSTALLEATVAR